jgi:hypothetical protein
MYSAEYAPSFMAGFITSLALSDAAADLAVAGAAVDRPVTTRNEGDLGHNAAVRARGGVHLSRGLTAEAGEDAVTHITLFGLGSAGSATRCAASRTAGGLVLQTLGRVELLLPGSKDETAAAVLA